MIGLIVAKRRIEKFSSDSLNEDYEDEDINFEKGSILGYRNLPRIYIYKDYEELAGNESIFSVIKVGLPDDDEVKPLTFDISDHRIKILVDPKTYSSYINFQQKSSIAMSMLVLPAVMYMIDELRQSYDTFSDRKWFIKIKQFYKSQGKDLRDDVIFCDRNIVEIAQEMLKSPIGRAYRELLEDEVW